jgi:hypothetical protein
MGLSVCADCFNCARRCARNRSGVSCTGDFRNRYADRADWCAGLFLLAQSRGDVSQSISRSTREYFLYACKIKETTDGCGSCSCGEARQALEVVAQRPVAQDGELDEPKRVAEAREDEAQETADKEKATLKRAEAVSISSVIPVALSPSPLSKAPSSPCLFR